MSANLEPWVNKIKKLMEEKGTIVKHPENGVDAIVVREEKMGNSYSVSIGIGVVSSINVRYFEIRGHIFDDTFNSFSDSVLRIEPKAITSSRGRSYLCATIDGIVRVADEAKWADKLVKLSDLEPILANYGN
jgi:hypothetical protein